MNETCAMRLTSTAPAAIAVVRIEGPKANAIVADLWRPAKLNQNKQLQNKPNEPEIDRIRYGHWQPVGSEWAEDVVVCWTGVDRIEVHCHGGAVASQRILESMIAAGAVEARAGDYLEELGRESSSLAVAAAAEELLSAATPLLVKILCYQLNCAWEAAIDRIEGWRAAGELEKARVEVDRLLDLSRWGLKCNEPFSVGMVGPPNVGKSSLLNRLLGYERSIVHGVAGTTRDMVAELVSLGGLPCRLMDTAGLRQGVGGASELDSGVVEVEREGIARALKSIASWDCVLLVVDPIEGWTDWHQDVWEKYSERCLVVVNKSDLLESAECANIPSGRRVVVSAKTGDGIDRLMVAIRRLVLGEGCEAWALRFDRAEPEASDIDTTEETLELADRAFPIREFQVEWLVAMRHRLDSESDRSNRVSS